MDVTVLMEQLLSLFHNIYSSDFIYAVIIAETKKAVK